MKEMKRKAVKLPGKHFNSREIKIFFAKFIHGGLLNMHNRTRERERDKEQRIESLFDKQKSPHCSNSCSSLSKDMTC